MAGTPLSRYALRMLRGEANLLGSLFSPLLVWEAPPSDSEESVMPTLSGATVPQRPSEGESIVFEMRKDPAKTNPFGMGVTVGRTPNNDIVLPDQSISRFHGYFQFEPKTNAWRLVDAESRNGVWLDGVRLSPNTPTPLGEQHRLTFGEVSLLFLQPARFVAWLNERIKG